MPDLKQRNDVKLQTLPWKVTSPQILGSDTKPLLRNRTRSTPVQVLNDSQENQSEKQSTIDTSANHSGDQNIPPPENTALQLEERIVREKQMKSTCQGHPQLF